MALLGYLVCYPGTEIQTLVFTTAHRALLTRSVLHPKTTFSVSQKSDSASTREAEAGKSLSMPGQLNLQIKFQDGQENRNSVSMPLSAKE